jgi:hypothetical protein
MGGQGLRRQVKARGFWFPVFDLSQAKKKDGSAVDDVEDEEEIDPETVKLNEIPLAIASPPPPPVQEGAGVDYTFYAVGGKPPYRWALETVAALSLDATTGRLLGPAADADMVPLRVNVFDAAGEAITANYTLVVKPAEPLVINTPGLPTMEATTAWEAQLTATGGVPPYTWSIQTELPLTCDPTTGALSGSFPEPGDYEVKVTVVDVQESRHDVALELSVVSPLEIATQTPLPNAEPGVPYTLKLEAKGGSVPYRWSTPTALPGSLRLTPEGSLMGTPNRQEMILKFKVVLTDAGGLRFQKTLELPVMQSLLAVPSRDRVGLAWRPSSIGRALRSAVANCNLRRAGPDGEVAVYNGIGDNLVDRGLTPGAEYEYFLTAYLTDGRTVVAGRRRVRLLPMTLTRAVPGQTADPYADRVVEFTPLSPGGYGSGMVPHNITGPPDGRSTYTPATGEQYLASLHASPSGGGSVVLEFTDNIVDSGPGADFTLFENVFFVARNPNNRFMEPAVVEVALYPDQWYAFPFFVNPSGAAVENLRLPTYYSAGFAGINAITGDDPTDPSRSGGDSFDLATLAVLGHPAPSWIRYIRIRATGDAVFRDLLGKPVRHTTENNALTGTSSSGFDLDAACAVHY